MDKPCADQTSLLSRRPVDTPESNALGESERKHIFDIYHLLTVLISFLCLIAAFILVGPWTSIPWKLGLKRQFQAIGFLLSVMNLCLETVTPQFYVMIEARFGHSILQNYDAILRNSFISSHTNVLWRIVLLVTIALPLGLSLLYKEFAQGTGTSIIHTNATYYGLTGPSGFSQNSRVGTSLMVNATLPFIFSAQDKHPLPSMPQAYGFNTLLLSSESMAYLDAPMPNYTNHLQSGLSVDDAYMITANVHATITTYNHSIETHRNDPEYWWSYLDQMGINRSDNIDVGNVITSADTYTGHRLGLMVNNFAARNASWCFLSFFPANSNDVLADFQVNALSFDTRRALCEGTWRITYNSLELVSGSCNRPPLPDTSQDLFYHNSFSFGPYYVPMLMEYLGPFSDLRNESHWLLPTFVTAVAGMYWSRATTMNGYHPDLEKLPEFYSDPGVFNATSELDQVYYAVDDQLVSIRRTMNTSWLLYFTLALQPALITIILVASACMKRTPVDRGFGIVALLAGVRKDTLKLLEGASYSGKLKRPLTVEITVAESVSASGHTHPKNEYILRNKTKDRTPSHSSIPLSTLSPPTRTTSTTKGLFSRIQARYGDRQATEYGMLR